MPNPTLDRLFPSSRVVGVAALALLALSMLATRYHHFSSVLHLADTSWAVFFLAGLWFRSARVLAGLLVVAVLVDLGSVVMDGAAMASCFSPAYPGVLLAYAALWGAGRLARRQLEAHASAGLPATLGLIAAALIVGVTAAFGIANVTFFAFSGQFETMSAGDYAASVAPYLTGYLGTAATYAAVGIVALATSQLIRESLSQHRHV
ncbi:hypothetical protein LV476_09295 [Guyparkeria hydrothermalis]|uniref:hypothetical protein n=1 Tax=Guyparkeria hydrothermalis TaxID=923 RepID=UPI0020209B4C|nr:hypothetical protein [Guyparkeria hydrothermalis]MCL7745128.1 hypothetical protein [Guyparkeria hydrothermalis]